MASERYTNDGPVVKGPGGFTHTFDTKHEARWAKRILEEALDAAEKARGEEDVFVNTEDSLHGDVDIQVRGMTENYGVLRPIVAVVKRGYKLVIRKASEGGK